MKFSVTRIEAKPGETLRIVLTTRSAMPKTAMAHNVVVLAKGVNAAKFNEAAAPHRTNDFLPPDRQKDILAATGLAGGGETVEVTFTVPQQPGNYDYICTFPGHFKMGMRGVLAVK
jgi:azurin